MLFVKDGIEGAGDPDDRGCETQSSDNESSHAWSMVIRSCRCKTLEVLTSEASWAIVVVY